MSELFISLALPNPAGKDRTPSNQVSNQQLNAEWVEFTASSHVSIEGVGIYHQTYDAQCRLVREEHLMSFTGSLRGGQSIRVHSGKGTNAWESQVLHVYLGRGNFVWNNRCGDRAILRNQTAALIDWASYDPNPPEGATLWRETGTNHLTVGVAAYRR